jgi:hypothetical protein
MTFPTAPLYWHDPDPIEGNDYRVTSLQIISEEMARITYNQGLSEAEVFLRELFDDLITISEKDLTESLTLAMHAEHLDDDTVNSVIATLLDAICNNCE